MRPSPPVRWQFVQLLRRVVVAIGAVRALLGTAWPLLHGLITRLRRRHRALDAAQGQASGPAGP